MGNFISISGHLVCYSDEQLPVFRAALEESVNVAYDYGLSRDQADLYMKGWRILDNFMNYRDYAAYSGHIRSFAIDYLQYQILFCLKQVLKANLENTYITGMFYVVNDDEEERLIWEIHNNKFNSYKIQELDGRSQFEFLESIEIEA
ncbi:hypothetical protein [Chitinophaga sp. Cy-1792]|uniref:hypothetical protein n=1 Tax=Chitinophaga sp. Cy-1792 TaxID=2608339 RepID=UPI00141E885D|nr:hypothetical protein [Chitinophaga sp. Cy-1792]NIG55810.1 hypothetical protein [Chitinophaga sp. Cy-1792]